MPGSSKLTVVLTKPLPQNLRVEVDVALRVARHHGDVVKTLHGLSDIVHDSESIAPRCQYIIVYCSAFCIAKIRFMFESF